MQRKNRIAIGLGVIGWIITAACMYGMQIDENNVRPAIGSLVMTSPIFLIIFGISRFFSWMFKGESKTDNSNQSAIDSFNTQRNERYNR